jgi:hypothetical protein
VLQGKLRMRIVGKVLADLCVTGDTRVGTHIAGCRSCGWRGSLGCTGLLAGVTRGARDTGVPQSGECDDQRNTKKHTLHRASTFMVQQNLDWI